MKTKQNNETNLKLHIPVSQSDENEYSLWQIKEMIDARILSIL